MLAKCKVKNFLNPSAKHIINDHIRVNIAKSSVCICPHMAVVLNQHPRHCPLLG